MSSARPLPPNVVGAPDIRVARGDVAVDERVEVDGQGKVIGKRVGHVTGLRRYRAHRDITLRQYAAGERLAVDHDIAKRSQRIIANLDQTIRGNSDQHAAMMRAIVERRTAESRVDRAIKALPSLLQSITSWVVLADKAASEWADGREGFRDREGLTVLKVALESLADHYGLDGDGLTIAERRKRVS